MFTIESEQKKSFAKCSAAQTQEDSQILVNLWCEASKDTRNGHAYQQIAKKLQALQIYWAGDQCREQIKLIKSKHQKTRDQNCTSGKSPTSCLFYEEFDQALCMELMWCMMT